MRLATLVAPDRKAYLVRLRKGIATPIGRAFERPGVDPLRELVPGRALPR